MTQLIIASWLILISILVNPTFSYAKTAKQKISFIRDAEIENIIREYSKPIFIAAELEPTDINIFLVNNKALNAFVAGGQKLFINTGLIMKSKNAGQIIGVIAHETGHIAGGHLSGVRDAMKNSSAANILAMVLGGLATIKGRGDVGSAIIAGGQNIGMRNFLYYSRSQEGAADAAAMRYLESTGQSAVGMLEFFEMLRDQELLSFKRQDPYFRSHPLTTERIRAVRAFIEQSQFKHNEVRPAFAKSFVRMKAKLKAFLEKPTLTLRAYEKEDKRLEARYARAIAYYRKADLDNAIQLIDGLILEHPNDPYFHELKGQILFENGRLKEALPNYKKAVDLSPETHLLNRALGRVLVEINDQNLLKRAIYFLTKAVNIDKNDPFSWRLLGSAWGKAGDKGKSSLAFAEASLLIGKTTDALFHAKRASSLLKKNSAGWIQAQDILLAIKNNKKK